MLAGVGVTSTYKVFVPPIKNLDSSDQSYEFELPVLDSSLIDLQGILIYVRGRVRKQNAEGAWEALVKDEQAVVSNNSLHTLFDSVSVTMGANQEIYHQSHHPHKAYLKQLLRLKDQHAPNATAAGLCLLTFCSMYGSA